MATPYNTAASAVHAGDHESLRRVLTDHPPVVRDRDPGDGGTLLHVAAWADDPVACEMLIDSGADPAAVRLAQLQPEHRHAGSGTQSPLALALENDRMAAAHYLRTVQITPDNLWMAASLGNMDRLSRFFDREGELTSDAADPNKCGTAQHALDDALVAAAHHHHRDAVAYLLDQGADASGRDHFGMTALHYAVQGDLALTKLLVSRGADARVRDYQFDATPVGWARYQRQEDTLAYLLAHCKIDPADAETSSEPDPKPP